LKTDVARPITGFWQALSEVPGWPDAPLGVRLRRLWPLALPVAGCAVLAFWTMFVREPMRDQVRAAHAELVALEAETDLLRQTLSEQTAADVTQQAAAARAQLLESPAVLEERLLAFVQRARTAGWEATYQIYGLTEKDTAGDPGTHVLFAPARVHLEPRADNHDRFNSLLTSLTALAAIPGRVEMTRLVIRADQPGVSVVDVNIRAGCLPAHEKAAE